MTREQLRQIEAAYEAATGAWDSADWTHERLPRSRDEAGYAVMCEGGDVEHCTACAEAEADAAEAERLAADAMTALRAGDVRSARQLATQVRSLERTWGDAPTWGAWESLIAAAAAAE